MNALLVEWLPMILAMMMTGALAGLLAGLLGVGGGLIIVPVLYFVLQGMGVDPDVAIRVATGTSLLVIVPTSLASVRAHHKRGNVDWLLIRRWSSFVVAGVLAGSFVAMHVGGDAISAVFGTIALLAAANMLLRPNAPPLARSLPALPVQGVMAGTVGFFSVMVGIGGATLSVPMLTVCNYPSHRAVGSAACFGLLIALPGASVMLLSATPEGAPAGTVGSVSLAGFAVIAPLTVLLAPAGAWLGSKLDARWLTRVFALFLCLSGGRMLLKIVGV